MIERYTLPEIGAVWTEEAKFRSWLEVELAVCRARAQLGEIPAEEVEELAGRAGFTVERIREIEEETNHDVIAFVSNVAETVNSPVARHFHFGLTSSDVVDTAGALQLREALDLIAADARELALLLCEMALEHRHTIMVGRTHGVHAEPTVFGHRLAVWAFEMERNLERLSHAREVAAVGKISGAVGVYANVDPKVEAIACEELGIRSAPASTQIVQRDRHAEVLATLAILGSTIEKIALEIRGAQRTEVRELAEPFGRGQKGSSAMPHKRNPILCERLCGMARLMRGYAGVGFENNALWQERDISHSSAERVVLPDATILAHYMLRTTTRVLHGLQVYKDRMLRNLNLGGGVVEVGEGWALAFKVESHNHPSAVEPYEGAATGVGGIIRDILAMGARPVALLDSLRFGPLGEERNRYLFREVVRGIGGYGNAVGVPTVGGEVEFARAYSGNPLVNAMCVGLIRTEDLVRSRATGERNLVVLLGSKTGRDGIHGATFASDELSEESESKRSNVQVGDPFAEKMLIECCLRLLEEGLLVSLQDLGAAGITSSASEMAAKGGVGIEIETENVPLRESGMEPYEVVISESQERMLAVVEPDKADRVLEMAGRYGLVGAVIGRVAGHGDLRVKSGGESVGSVPAEHLANAPVYERELVRPPYLDEVQALDLGSLPQPEDYNEVLLRMLAHPILCSRRSIFEQYDHEVGADTVVAPGADAAVMRIKGTKLGYAITTDGRGRHCYLDPRGGGAATVAEAYRNLSCVGAEPVAITNCLNFGNPEKPEGYYQLAECIEGMAKACEALGTPVVSGNVSLYNETEAGAVYPTPVVGMVGVLEDVERHATPGFKRAGDRVVVLGGAPSDESPLAGSDYLDVVHGKVAGRPPGPDLAAEREASDLVRGMIRSGLVDTAHDLSGGGEAVALAEMALAGGIGFEYEDHEIESIVGDGRAVETLFGEEGAGFLVAVPEERWDDLQGALSRVSYDVVGYTGGDRFKIGGLIDLSLNEMREAYERDLFGAPGGAEVAH